MGYYQRSDNLFFAGIGRHGNRPTGLRRGTFICPCIVYPAAGAYIPTLCMVGVSPLVILGSRFFRAAAAVRTAIGAGIAAGTLLLRYAAVVYLLAHRRCRDGFVTIVQTLPRPRYADSLHLSSRLQRADSSSCKF